MKSCTFTSYDELPLTLRIEDLMPVLGIGRNNAYNLVRSGRIRALKIGRQYRVPREELKRYLESGASEAHLDPYTAFMKR